MQSQLQAQRERKPLLSHVQRKLHFQPPSTAPSVESNQHTTTNSNQHPPPSQPHYQANAMHAATTTSTSINSSSNHLLDHTTSDSTSLLPPHTTNTAYLETSQPTKPAGAAAGAAGGPAALAPYYVAHWVCFFLLGLINNFHFVIVLSSAYSLAVSFDALHLIGVIQWATVILGMAAKIWNTLYLLKTSEYTRMVWSTLLCVLGLMLLVLSTRMSFAVAIIAICVIGSYSAMCESVVLGYLRHFAPALTGAWSAGTGWSGVAGTIGYLLMFSILNWSNELIYALCIPTLLVYILAFHYVHETSHPYIQAISAASQQHLADAPVAPPTAAPPANRFQHVWRVFKQVRSPALHLAAVYFLEYVCIVGFASASNPAIAGGGGWWYDNAYEILSFCYQAGVLVSRSSIAFVQIRRIEWLTAIQTVNFCVWFAQAYWHFMPLWMQFVLMVWVGLMGGGMYVNVFYIMTRNDGGGVQVDKENRELAINVVSSFYYVGIISSSLFEIILLNALLH